MTDFKAFVRAILHGAVAACVCASLELTLRYILAFSLDLPVALLWLAAGAVIGSIVCAAGEGRGGRWYAALAMILTYLSVGAYLTAVVIVAHPDQKSSSDAPTPIMVLRALAESAAHPNSSPSPSVPGKAPPDPVESPLEAMWIGFLTCSFLLPISACMPVVIGLKAPVLFPVMGLAVYSACRMCTKVRLPICGPFELAASADNQGENEST